MRISDWSSDVCSSDLHEGADSSHSLGPRNGGHGLALWLRWRLSSRVGPDVAKRIRLARGGAGDQPVHPLPRHNRSEEQTSELQSLMRISYAVFCLQKTQIKRAASTLLL